MVAVPNSVLGGLSAEKIRRTGYLSHLLKYLKHLVNRYGFSRQIDMVFPVNRYGFSRRAA